MLYQVLQVVEGEIPQSHANAWLVGRMVDTLWTVLRDADALAAAGTHNIPIVVTLYTARTVKRNGFSLISTQWWSVQ